MSTSIEIVDRGRGPQLSTSRITVQDLVPYLRQKLSYDEIIEIMPVLTVQEIQAVERYIERNYEAVMDQDRRIDERAAARRQPPEVEAAERRARQERLDAARTRIRQERNGAQHPG